MFLLSHPIWHRVNSAQNKFNWFVQVLKEIIIYTDLESRHCVLAKWMMQTLISKGFRELGISGEQIMLDSKRISHLSIKWQRRTKLNCTVICISRNDLFKTSLWTQVSNFHTKALDLAIPEKHTHVEMHSFPVQTRTLHPGTNCKQKPNPDHKTEHTCAAPARYFCLKTTATHHREINIDRLTYGW